MLASKQLTVAIDFNSVGKKISAEKRNSYRFETTWGWANDDRIFIFFGWTISLSTYGKRVNGTEPQKMFYVH